MLAVTRHGLRHGRARPRRRIFEPVLHHQGERARAPGSASPRSTASSSRAAATSGSTASRAGDHVQGLPAATARQPPRRRPSSPPTAPARSTGTETILVVEDEEALRKVARRTPRSRRLHGADRRERGRGARDLRGARGRDSSPADRRGHAADERQSARRGALARRGRRSRCSTCRATRRRDRPPRRARRGEHSFSASRSPRPT